MGQMIKVGMADLKICKAPDAVTTLGLGSCVGIAIRDPQTKIGGLAHIMLPDSTQMRAQAVNIPKFADTGAKELVNQLVKAGAGRTRLVAKIAGGAQMFAFQGTGNNDMMAVGERNAKAVRQVLAELKIPILAEDCGLNYGRTVEFFPETGDYVIKAVGKPVKTI
ncbi:MAG: chemotaxis protein CheD [Lachnospiraceae bacterium]|nr:chemotaxis protein CheD [Lachnospiraceae bacterium]